MKANSVSVPARFTVNELAKRRNFYEGQALRHAANADRLSELGMSPMMHDDMKEDALREVDSVVVHPSLVFRLQMGKQKTARRRPSGKKRARASGKKRAQRKK